MYRAFDHVEFDPFKSDLVLEAQGFDLWHVGRMFPGLVLEREDTRSYEERRYHVIGRVADDVIFAVYTPRGRACRLITAWRADRAEEELWFDVVR